MAHARAKRTLWTACKFLLGFAVLAYVLGRNWDPPGGLGLAHVVSRPVRVVPLLLAAVFCVIGPLLTFVRWYYLVRAQGLPFRPRDALRLGCIGYFWSTVLPGSVGGDVVRAALLAREQSRRTAAGATVLVDRIVGLGGLFVLVAGVGALCWLCRARELQQHVALRSVVGIAWAVSGAGLLVWLVASLLPEEAGRRIAGGLTRLPVVGPVTGELWRALWLYRSRAACVFGALLLAVVGHVAFLCSFHFGTQVFQGDPAGAGLPSLAEHFLIIPAGLLFQSVFPSPGGVGGAEYGFGQLYELVGRPAAQGVLGSLAVRAVTWGVCLAGSLGYLGARVLRRRPGGVRAPVFRPWLGAGPQITQAAATDGGASRAA